MSVSISYNAGGELDTVKKINNVDRISHINGFASYTQPYNTMKMLDIPAIVEDYELEYEFKNNSELLALTVTCSGYGENDNYDIYCNGNKIFDNWYCSEVKEGLFLGTSTYVYTVSIGSKLKLVFHNNSGTSKKVWLGLRMLISTT